MEVIRHDVALSVRAVFVLRELARDPRVPGRVIAPARWASTFRFAAKHGPRIALPPLETPT